MTGDGSDTTLTLSIDPISENNVQVYIDGVYQNKDTFSVSGTTLTFSEAPPNGSKVEAMTLTQTDINTATLLTDADGDTKVQVEESSDEDKIRFDTGGTERVIIDSTGVGIGTSSPTGKLEIAATGTNAAPHIKLVESGDTREFNIYNDGSGNGHLVLADSDDDTSDTEIVLNDNGIITMLTGNSERMRIDSSGNVDIKSSNLYLTGSNDRRIKLSDSGVAGVSDSDNTVHIRGDDDFMRLSAAGNGGFIFEENGTERMRINSSGHVGINTSNPQYGLHLTGSANFESAYSLNATVLRINSTNSSNSYFAQAFYSGGTLAGYIYVNASNNTTQFATSSDYRLKENVNYNFDALSRVKQLKPARFNFIADAETTVDGFIAHEVSDIVPEAIIGEKDGELMQGIDQSKLVPILTKAIQEQQELIETLQAKVEALENG